MAPSGAYARGAAGGGTPQLPLAARRVSDQVGSVEGRSWAPARGKARGWWTSCSCLQPHHGATLPWPLRLTARGLGPLRPREGWRPVLSAHCASATSTVRDVGWWVCGSEESARAPRVCGAACVPASLPLQPAHAQLQSWAARGCCARRCARRGGRRLAGATQARLVPPRRRRKVCAGSATARRLPSRALPQIVELQVQVEGVCGLHCRHSLWSDSRTTSRSAPIAPADGQTPTITVASTRACMRQLKYPY